MDYNIPQVYLEIVTPILEVQVDTQPSVSNHTVTSTVSVKREPHLKNLPLNPFDDSYADFIKMESDIKTEEDATPPTSIVKRETLIGSVTLMEKTSPLKVVESSSLQDHLPTCQLKLSLEKTEKDSEIDGILQCCDQVHVATMDSHTVPVATAMHRELPVVMSKGSSDSQIDHTLHVATMDTGNVHVAMDTQKTLSLVSDINITEKTADPITVTQETSGLHVATSIVSSFKDGKNVTGVLEIIPSMNPDDSDSTSSSGTIILENTNTALDNLPATEYNSTLLNVAPMQIPDTLPVATSMTMQSGDLPMETCMLFSSTVVDDMLLLPDGSSYNMDKLLSVTTHMLSSLERD